MKALTIWQPWASLIIIGAKPIEWRSHARCRAQVGERIVVHAGARKPQPIEILQLRLDCLREAREIDAGQPATQPTGLCLVLALDALAAWYLDPAQLPLSAGLGTAVLGEPKLAADHGFPVDSDRLDQQNWGWPLSGVEPFLEPLPMRGARGLWPWPEPREWLP